jgi:hypothetical protein
VTFFHGDGMHLAELLATAGGVAAAARWALIRVGAAGGK